MLVILLNFELREMLIIHSYIWILLHSYDQAKPAHEIMTVTLSAWDRAKFPENEDI